MTGDHKINPDAQCCVMTTEILRNMLFKGDSFFKKFVRLFPVTASQQRKKRSIIRMLRACRMLQPKI